MAVPARTKFIVLSILLTLATINFTRTAFEILENSKRLETLSQEVKVLEDQKAQLQSEVDYKRTDAYIEEKARNELSLIKPGEKVYIMPEDLRDSVNSHEVLGASLEQLANNSNLKQWFDLFVHGGFDTAPQL